MTARPGVRTGIPEGMGAALGTFDHEDVLEQGRLVIAAVVARNGSLVLRPLRVLAALALYTDRVSDADSCLYTGRQGLLRQVLAAPALARPRVCAARGTPKPPTLGETLNPKRQALVYMPKPSTLNPCNPQSPLSSARHPV